MSKDDPQSPHDQAKQNEKSALLDELESIKDLLEDDGESAQQTIPLLQDVIDDTPDSTEAILDIQAIFDDGDNASTLSEESAVEFPSFKLDVKVDEVLSADTDMPAQPEAESANAPISAIDDLDINLLIQEIVDEQIPLLEDALRKRLEQYSPKAILALANKLGNQ